MSFASEVKNELCRVPVSRHCCAVAEAYGVLLYCHTFTTREIRIVKMCIRDRVSEKHAGFVVNRGGATFDDVLRLMDHIRSEVLRTSGVELEPEVKIIRG